MGTHADALLHTIATVAPPDAIELTVRDIRRALDTYIAGGFHVEMVTNGLAYLRSPHEDRTVILHASSPTADGAT